MSGVVARSWFRCRNCGATLGELVGVRLVVVVRGLSVTFPLVPDACFTCRKCGEPNTLAPVLHCRTDPSGLAKAQRASQDGRVESA